MTGRGVVSGERRNGLRWWGSLVLLLSPFVAASEDEEGARLELQRAAFRDVYPEVERGNWAVVEAQGDLLENYVLWPDLRAVWLRRHLDDEPAVRTFLERYGNLKPTRNLRYRHALRLAAAGRHDEYLALYDGYFAKLADASLDCLAANALMAVGQPDRGLALGERLWLTGRSQVKECDPVFARMKREGHLGDTLVRQRYELAIGARDFGLARYLARSLGAAEQAAASRWLRAQNGPEQFLRTADLRVSEPGYRAQLGFAAQRLARTDPAAAFAHWSRLKADFPFGSEQDRSVAREIALWAARLRLNDASRWLGTLESAALDNEVHRWRIRHALRRGDWAAVLASVDALDADEAGEAEWRYWHAVALAETAQEADAMLVFSSLARSTGYYGFLAADRLNVDYALRNRDIAADEDEQRRLEQEPALIRARELFLTGLDGPARAEWNEAMRELTEPEQAQAALLAKRWGWHSRAIAAASRAGAEDSLHLRYPLAYRDEFERAAQTTGIRESWSLAVARSESIFMRDVRSSAGAVGLMQLMPATGQSTARSINLRWRGLASLVDPADNIRLGTEYLRQMHDRFGGHPAVATAAYNAGPLRVEQWLPVNRGEDARIWIESIPFNETRDYVRRVLAAEIVFEWRLRGSPARLSDRLPEIPAAPKVAAVSAH